MSPWVTIRRRNGPETPPAPPARPASPMASPKLIAAVRLGLGQEDAPAVVRHLDVAEVGPALGLHADRGAQIDVVRLEAPPGPSPATSRGSWAARLPAPVAGAGCRREVRRCWESVPDSRWSSNPSPHSRNRAAPAAAVDRQRAVSPTAFGRWKIQFCQAERRPKILMSMVSARRNAGSPPCR